MDLDDFLLMHRKAEAVLRSNLLDPKVSFDEMALLCHLALHKGPQRSSDLAAYEGVIRPTMSHRLQRLAKLQLLERAKGEEDRRTVLYGITRPGRWLREDFLEALALSIDVPDPLASCSPERLGRYMEAAGTVPVSASDLVLLVLRAEGRPLQVTEVQRRSGLLQPTCSMALVSLVSRGLVDRAFPEDATDAIFERELDLEAPPVQARPALLTAMGADRAAELAERVRQAVVHR